jgi:hypothetical protein
MKKSSIALICIWACLSSCTSVEKTYSGFYQKQQYQKMAVAADGTALQDGQKKQEIFLADKSVKAAALVQSQVTAVLRSKGYLASSLYTSTGLSVPNNMQLIVSNSPTATTGTSLSGPYTMTRNGSKATAIQRLAAERLFDRMISTHLIAKSSAQMTFPESAQLGIPSGQYLVAVSGLARNVNTSKQVGQAFLLAAVSLGTVVAWEPDVAMIQVAIIDPKTQRIVWANQINGKVQSSEDALKNINKLFSKLPTYGSTKK